ncbi:MAG: sulfatase [Xanthomonadales bacterium]|nr:sulfatase [Xanthomonadales bacterium]
MGRSLVLALLAGLAIVAPPPSVAGEHPPNILLIAVDDMGYDTPESFGGWVEGLTPHIDSLAREGMVFSNAYNTSSRCAPSRGSIMTGLYQDNYAEKRGSSDTTVREGVRTIPEYLREKNYMTGLFGKDTHYRPLEKYAFDVVSPMAAMAVGRSPELYARNIANFIDEALVAGRPFFVSANTHDPHRPYAGAPGESESLQRRFKSETRKLKEKPEFILPPAVTAFSDRGIEAPGFIPDHELVREEFGYYLNSSHRADQFVGAMLQTLEDKGVLDDTLVIFHSDNGMHWPFAKSNVYVASVKTPFVIYWQGRSVAGTRSNALVSTVDILPTILEATGIPAPDGLPGKSLLPLLDNPGKAQHEQVFATLNAKGDIRYEMRSVIGEQYIYIYNKWVDGKAVYHNGKYPGGLALKGFEAAARESAAAKRRFDFFYHRVPEELYDLRQDPNALHNLVGEAIAATTLQAMRQLMLDKLTANDDPYLENYQALLERISVNSGTAQPVWSMDFEDVQPGSPAAQLLQHEKLSLAPGRGVAGSTGLRAEYTGFEKGSERIGKHLFLPEPGLEFSLNYDVSFDKDFQFVKGGKLLGLGPARHITGGRPIIPEGWSARVTFKDGGGIKLYTYHQDMQGQYGDRGYIQQPFTFEKERYYSVSLHVRVNDPPEASNGFSRLYVDGKLIERHENLRLRGTGGDATLVNKFMFSSFHGGHSPDNAPRDKAGNYTTVYATFDNISVYPGERVRPGPGR